VAAADNDHIIGISGFHNGAEYKVAPPGRKG